MYHPRAINKKIKKKHNNESVVKKWNYDILNLKHGRKRRWNNKINTKMVNLMPAILLIIANVNKHAN